MNGLFTSLSFDASAFVPYVTYPEFDDLFSLGATVMLLLWVGKFVTASSPRCHQAAIRIASLFCLIRMGVLTLAQKPEVISEYLGILFYSLIHSMLVAGLLCIR